MEQEQGLTDLKAEAERLAEIFTEGIWDVPAIETRAELKDSILRLFLPAIRAAQAGGIRQAADYLSYERYLGVEELRALADKVEQG